MYFTTVVIVLVLLYAVEILAVDENCAAPNDGTPIENCCNLKKPAQFEFGETTANKPKVYKLKNFCNKNCTTVTINGYCDTLTDGGGWLVVQRRISTGSESFHRNWVDYENGVWKPYR